MSKSLEEIKKNPSLIRERWLSPQWAEREVVEFEHEFGQKHLRFACHAALAMILTPEVLNLIRINFLINEAIPWVAEIDLLLSRICRSIDEGIYTVEPGIREVLLVELENLYGQDYAEQIKREIASFLLVYWAQKQDVILNSEIRQTQEWIAKAYLDLNSVLSELRETLIDSSNQEESSLRLAEQIQVIKALELLADPLEKSNLQEQYQDLISSSRILAHTFYGKEKISPSGFERIKRELETHGNLLLSVVVEQLETSEAIDKESQITDIDKETSEGIEEESSPIPPQIKYKKILILSSSPDNMPKISVDKEIKAIEQERERSKNRDKFKIISKLAVKPGDLIHILQEEEPEIVHFCGHAKKIGLVFENELEEAQIIGVKALAKLFEKFKDKVECVLLNASNSDNQAKAINEHIQYVIGMTGLIEDNVAIKFATSFYSALLAGRSYKDAYEVGYIDLKLLGIQDDLPSVFLEKSPPITAQPRESKQKTHPQIKHKKILIFSSSLDDMPRIRTDKEIKAIMQELERSKNRDKFEIITKLAVKPDDLIHVLQEQEPEIVHFCGYGKKTGLVFENELGEVQNVKSEALANLFKIFQDKVECVLLNVSYSNSQAKAINEHIQYVIGMKDQIEDTAAIKFAVHFYASLIAGRSYKDAYDFGRIALDLLGIQDDLLPVFLEKSQPLPAKQPLNLPPSLHFTNVINSFKVGRVIPFLGPGVNFYVSDKYPITNLQLADYLARNLGISEVEDWNLQEIAEYISLRSSIQDFYSIVRQFFERSCSPNKLHQFFANLPREMIDKGYPFPYKLLVTTNYDDMLERAFREANQPFDLVFYVAEGENRGSFQYKPYDENIRTITSKHEVIKKDRPVILKLYGTFENENFVITEEHHMNYLVHYKINQLLSPDLLEILWAQYHHILFMGYSPNDANLRLAFNRLWGERGIRGESWMIHQSKLRGLDKKFWKMRNVELLDSDLEDYLAELDERIKTLPPKKSSYYEKWKWS